MKKYILSAIACFITFYGFSQTDSLVRLYPVKISSEKKLIIPIDEENYLFEHYNYFKKVYFLNSRDTLTKVSHSTYQGSSISLTFNKFEKHPTKHICDSLINFIRNSSLSFRTSSILDDSARFNIGYDNQTFESGEYERHPTKTQQYELCHNLYIELNSIWHKHQLEIIKDIRAQKQNRLIGILLSNRISEEFIENFLITFNQCEPDQRALLVILTRQPKTTLQALEDLSELDFYSIQLKLSDLPANIRTQGAIEQLESIETRSKYRRKMIRTLKKNES